MKKIDMTGWKMREHGIIDSRVTVLKQADKHTTSGIIRWECQCDCGTIFIADGTKLRNGHTKSCGCLQKEITSRRTRADLTNQKFGRLTALKPIGKRGANVLWLCRCECGNLKEVGSDDLLKNQTRSCGCLKSYGESLVSKYLTEKNIKFKQEYHPQEINLKFRSYPRFDFMLFNNANQLYGAIEVNGEQHYNKNNPWYNDNVEKNQQLKADYCKMNSIPLLILPYINGNLDYNLLNNFINSLEENDK